MERLACNGKKSQVSELYIINSPTTYNVLNPTLDLRNMPPQISGLLLPLELNFFWFGETKGAKLGSVKYSESLDALPCLCQDRARSRSQLC